MRILNILRSVLPGSLVYRLGDLRARIADRHYATKTIQETFDAIYRKNAWGGDKGQLHSGAGSVMEGIVTPYLAVVRQVLQALPMEQRCVVDLGCGDFQIGKNLIDLCSSYAGVDVAPSLIASLKERAYPGHVEFLCANIIEDPLPEGTICILRQVLQHLSNDEIAKILPKLRQFAQIIVTEHYPISSRFVAPNLDKAHGPGIRVSRGSAVCLDQPPFCVAASQVTELLQVPGDGKGGNEEAGLIKTFIFPGNAIP